MDIEKLTKMQIILLTLLVSFVTSIATGIVTVTLMDQAPPAITQTIHKVIEKTVENVMPNGQTAIVQKEIVVVKEQNLIADAIEKNSKNIVKIYKETEEKSDFVGFGVVVYKGGIIATDSSIVTEEGIYFANINGKNISIEIFPLDENRGISYFKVVDSEDGIFKPIFKTSNLVDSNSLRLGQSVITISGDESFEVTTGIISGFAEEDIEVELVVEATEDSEEKIEKEIKTIVWGVKTNIPIESIVPGSPLLSLEGEIIGINSYSSKNNIFTFINISKEDIKNLLDSLEEVETVE